MGCYFSSEISTSSPIYTLFGEFLLMYATLIKEDVTRLLLEGKL